MKKRRNTSHSEIRGLEKKNYLHVWRLQKETTTESLEKHVKNICGNDVPVIVDQIKHKTERDYFSFIIGVAESKYDTLCLPKSWTLNIEYCEWVWFRRSTSKL